MSLPGAGTSPTEQQTILEVINNKHTQPQATEEASSEAASQSGAAAGSSTEAKTASSPAITVTAVESATVKAPVYVEKSSTDTSNSAEANDDLVNSKHSLTNNVTSYSNESATSEIPKSTERRDTEATKETISPPPTVERQCSSNSASADQGHVLDIESHLIETYDEYQTPDDSVGINELLPQQDELTVGSSKVETEANVRTVIEVEPAGAISKKPLEFVVQTSQVQRIAESESEIEAKTFFETATVSEPETVERIEPCVDSDAIKETAERLVNEIEREVLEALQKCEAKNDLKADTGANKATEVVTEATAAQVLDRKEEEEEEEEEKTEPPTSLLDEISNSLSQKVDAQLSEVTSILKSSKPSHAAAQFSDSNGEALKVDVDQTKPNELKIVNVPSPKTPSDVQERKLFLESLPHIDSNAEAQKLADDCKREYYQSLKKYLIQSQTDRPPVPLQTYRWEDLRRAKERVSQYSHKMCIYILFAYYFNILLWLGRLSLDTPVQTSPRTRRGAGNCAALAQITRISFCFRVP